MKNLIKKLLREGINEINQKQLTVDYFKNRIPFLKNPWHEIDYDNGVQIFTDQVNHPDAKMIHPDKGIITFKHFKTGVNFEYSRGKVSGSDYVAHNFKITPIIMFEINSDDDLFKKIIGHIIRMQLSNIGASETIELPPSSDIPDSVLDKIVNEMNKTFFTFEEFLSPFGVDLNI